jgi:hypothetical protein
MTSGVSGTASGLVAYWPFSEGSGSTVADLSPFNNTGLLGDGDLSAEPLWVNF